MKLQNVIAFWGFPHPNLIKKYKEMYPNADWVDLDVDYGCTKQDILPESYCSIIKNIINGAFFYKEQIIAILAPIGKDKCDSGWFAAEILKDMGFNVVTSIFEEKTYKRDIRISTSDLPLRTKFELITQEIYMPVVSQPAAATSTSLTTSVSPMTFSQCEAKFGFWGVPPNDLSILELFPNNTHVYGWTRCVEACTPADIELEMYVDANIPTVFYSQSFCSKAQLAKYLADKYDGLYIDIDDKATNSTKAKIEAFLRLR